MFGGLFYRTLWCCRLTIGTQNKNKGDASFAKYKSYWWGSPEIDNDHKKLEIEH